MNKYRIIKHTDPNTTDSHFSIEKKGIFGWHPYADYGHYEFFLTLDDARAKIKRLIPIKYIKEVIE